MGSKGCKRSWCCDQTIYSSLLINEVQVITAGFPPPIIPGYPAQPICIQLSHKMHIHEWHQFTPPHHAPLRTWLLGKLRPWQGSSVNNLQTFQKPCPDDEAQNGKEEHVWHPLVDLFLTLIFDSFLSHMTHSTFYISVTIWFSPNPIKPD